MFHIRALQEYLTCVVKPVHIYKLYFITYLVYITIQYFHTENIKVRFLKIVLSDVIEIIVNLQQINKMESMIGLTQVFPYVYWTVHHCGS